MSKRPAFSFPIPKSGKQLIELFAYLSGLEAGPKSQSRLQLPQSSDACADAQPFENHPSVRPHQQSRQPQRIKR